jgi:dethiobiotin synthetase
VSRLFVSGTGTGVGKTLVTCILVRQLRAVGREVRALKPVISGFDPSAGADSDTGRLLAAMDEPLDKAAIGSISPWRFSEPLSPDMAAARDGRCLDVGEIAGFCRYAGPAEGDAVVITEGVGGVMAPLSEEETVIDWMTALNWPVVLVAGSYLGTLSHTLTAVEAVKYGGLPLSGVVISESADSPVPLVETIETIARFVTETPVIGLPRHDTARETVGTLPNIAKALGLIGARSEA